MKKKINGHNDIMHTILNSHIHFLSKTIIDQTKLFRKNKKKKRKENTSNEQKSYTSSLFFFFPVFFLVS